MTLAWPLVALCLVGSAFAIAWRALDLYRARCEITACKIEVEKARLEMAALKRTVETAIANVTAEVKAELAKTHTMVADTAAARLQRMQRRV